MTVLHSDCRCSVHVRLLDFSGVPSSPGRPVIELSTNRIQAQSDENSVTDEINLAWDVPDDDGGYPITGKIQEL